MPPASPKGSNRPVPDPFLVGHVSWSRPRQNRLGALLASPWGGVLRRHGVVAALALILTAAFQHALADLPSERAWNRAWADASLVLFALTMVAGAVLRLLDWRLLFDLRRELGIWAALLAGAHVYVVLGPWLRFDLAGLAGDAAFAMGNLVGIVALAYTLLLAVTSNDYAQRRLGSSWTHVQRGAVTCYVLVMLHTAYFLFLQPWSDAESGHASEALRAPFLVGVVTLVALRTAAFWKTAAHHARRGRS